MTDSSPQTMDAQWMDQALALASLGQCSTSPNPRVGCVLIKDGALIGSGWHQQAGGDHAEVMALKQAGPEAHGATAYITLEPCNHHGRTPPCSEALVEAGIKRAVVAIEDPDPRTAGTGIARLRQAGIDVSVGVGESAAHELNIGFIQRHQIGRPWMRLKLAASLDGRVTGPDGRSKWITSEPARADGHRWRAKACAVLTGINTVLADDPLLTARLNTSLQKPTNEPTDEPTERPVKQPIRVILDSHGRLPEHAKIFESDAPVWVVSTVEMPDWFAARASKDLQWHQRPADLNGRVDLGSLMNWLGEKELNEVHVEAGPTLSGALLENGWVDEVLIYQAPVFLGDGQPMVNVPTIQAFDQRLRMHCVEVRQLGPDQFLRLRWHQHESTSH